MSDRDVNLMVSIKNAVNEEDRCDTSDAKCNAETSKRMTDSLCCIIKTCWAIVGYKRDPLDKTFTLYFCQLTSTHRSITFWIVKGDSKTCCWCQITWIGMSTDTSLIIKLNLIHSIEEWSLCRHI